MAQRIVLCETNFAFAKSYAPYLKILELDGYFFMKIGFDESQCFRAASVNRLSHKAAPKTVVVVDDFLNCRHFFDPQS